MNNEPLIIKTSRWRLFIYSLTSGAIFIYLAIDFIKPNTREGVANMFMVIIMAALLLFTIHFMSDLIRRPPEIILTDEGIELRDQGFFIWADIEHFCIRHYFGDNDDEDLVLQMREPWGELKIGISNLSMGKKEVIDAILAYKGQANVYYAGEERK